MAEQNMQNNWGSRKLTAEKELEVYTKVASALELYRQIMKLNEANKGDVGLHAIRGMINGLCIDLIDMMEKEPCYVTLTKIKEPK